MNQYILCAAIWFNDGKEYVHQPKNINYGFVVCGWRHHNCFAQGRIFKVKLNKIEHTQGFLTNDNKFVDRIEAAKIAHGAGQTNELKKKLYSEDIY